MTETKTDNLDADMFPADSPESASPNADDFFEALDRKVNEGILEPEETTASNVQQSPSETTSEMSPQENGNLEHDWEKRYTDSSNEARKLNGQLKELEPYVPILNAMKQDPNLITHVRDYFEGGGKPPKSVKEQLGLDEDFIFDPDEAVTDSDSSSAKVLQSVIDGAVQRRLTTFQQSQQKEADNKNAEKSFRDQHQMSDEEWNEFVDYSKSRTLTLDDIYFLKNRDNRDTQVANSTREEMKDQMQRVRSKPQSAARAGSQGTPQKSGDDNIFDSILGIDKELDSMFG
tara:strand:+ start:16728 stop:17591 length:864 start_codon:yes stop_codon:yes gene_type:complete